MTAESLVVLALLIPAATAILIPLFAARPNPREAVTVLGALAQLGVVVLLGVAVAGGARPEVQVLEIVPGLAIMFRVEPLGMLFAGIAGSLWILASFYSIGYMRGHHEPRHTPFFTAFAVAIASTMGIALSGNLFTLFLFYEALSLSTYPLVAHRGDAAARRAGRIYLLMLIGSSIGLFLPAIAWTYFAAGTLDFAQGGILAGRVDDSLLPVLLALFVFGIGKAAVMPMHYWLPAAMVAPTPVSALLHAVAVVKAGVFTVLKVVVYVFGIDTLATSGASDWLVFVAAFSLLAASTVALTKDNLKARLAYSTVSQLAYIVLAAALATPAAIVGGALHIAMHAVGKITLFFCAGAIAVAAHKTEVSELDGIGRRMPLTMLAFFVASLSIIGLPPLGGVWSKWWIGVGAVEADHAWVVAVLMISSLLNVAYLMPIVARAFFLPAPGKGGNGPVAIAEAPLACLVPLCITAGLCLVLFFLAGPLQAFLQAIVAPAALPAGGG